MLDGIRLALTLTAMAIVASAAGATITDPPPINVGMATYGSDIKLTVTGASNSPLEATYALDVTSNSVGGDNRSVQRGRVRLVPGKKVTLITLNLGNLRSGKWAATLQVEAVGGGSYRQDLSSNSAQPKTTVD